MGGQLNYQLMVYGRSHLLLYGKAHNSRMLFKGIQMESNVCTQASGYIHLVILLIDHAFTGQSQLFKDGCHRDSLVGKVLAEEAWGLQFDSKHPRKS